MPAELAGPAAQIENSRAGPRMDVFSNELAAAMLGPDKP
jgi:hypothetical protein